MLKQSTCPNWASTWRKDCSSAGQAGGENIKKGDVLARSKPTKPPWRLNLPRAAWSYNSLLIKARWCPSTRRLR